MEAFTAFETPRVVKDFCYDYGRVISSSDLAVRTISSVGIFNVGFR
jgi:hypothetical protein